MLIDGRTLPDGSDLTADLAIIGAGAAGITIARELAGKQISVALIESGGEDFDEDAQSLADGDAVGIDYPLETARLRMLGGSTNHWGGWCRPLDAIDFEKRDWVPHSGWPITRAQLDAHYRRAQNICQIGPFAYDDPAYWQTASGGKMKPLPLAGAPSQTRFFLLSPPTKFGEVYKQDLKSAANIKTYLHTTTTEIVPTDDLASIDHLRLATFNGGRFTLKARFYVLATGGIDNARMLLASNSVAADGLGNGHDQVGRYFMEHPHLNGPGWTVVASPSQVAPYYAKPSTIAGTIVCGCFMPSPTYLRDNRLLNSIVTFHPREQVDADTDAFRTDAQVLSAVRRLHTRATSGDLGQRFGMNASCEQAPNPESRVTLSSERDKLGVPRLRLDWRLTAQDRDSLHQNLVGLARSFGLWGEARLQVLFKSGPVWEDPGGWGHHHMGTTRMGEDPKTSVVNADSRVHGISNLYVAGSSVFPTSGAANPTLTLVALSLRLADHLTTRFPV